MSSCLREPAVARPVTETRARGIRVSARLAAVWPLLIILVVATPSVAAAQASGGTEARSVRDGVYTTAQAERGEATFRQSCASCHTLGDFSGESFMRRWNGVSVGSFFELVANTMPQDFPGGLMPSQYADILAYVLSRNGLPAGGTELPSDVTALEAIAIQPPPP
jgi:S-disulfanyl-L-cysteine oxidoreductase SoxD